MDKAGMAKDTRKGVLEPSHENTRAAECLSLKVAPNY